MDQEREQGDLKICGIKIAYVTKWIIAKKNTQYPCKKQACIYKAHVKYQKQYLNETIK